MMLTVRQAAERLGCSPALVYQLCTERKIAHVRLGMKRGTIRIADDALDAFLGGATVPPDRPATMRAAPPRTLKHITL